MIVPSGAHCIKPLPEKNGFFRSLKYYFISSNLVQGVHHQGALDFFLPKYAICKVLSQHEIWKNPGWIFIRKLGTGVHHWESDERN